LGERQEQSSPSTFPQSNYSWIKEVNTEKEKFKTDPGRLAESLSAEWGGHRKGWQSCPQRMEASLKRPESD
jgi:hypothetical protein